MIEELNIKKMNLITISLKYLIENERQFNHYMLFEVFDFFNIIFNKHLSKI